MSNRIRTMALAATLILTCAPALGFAHANGTSSISGQIIDARNREPVAGAKIDLFQDTTSSKGAYPFAIALSRKDGSFHLSGLSEGQFRLEVLKMGYEVQVLSGLSLQEQEHLIVGEPIAMAKASEEYAQKMVCNSPLVRPDQSGDVYVVCAGR